MRTTVIPNWFSLLVAAAFPFAAAAADLPVATVGFHFLAGFAVVLLYVSLKTGIGAGALKLVAAVAVWLGFSIPFLTFVAVTFGATSGWMLILRTLGRDVQAVSVLPFACAAFALVLPSTLLWQRLNENVDMPLLLALS